MSTRTVERVDDWETVPFEGGYGGLRALADREFSGTVVAGPTRLFMLNGTVVGVIDGDIEDFEDAEGTARAAPHEALPLLAMMQERADEVRAQYYTEDTPIAEVDSTLTDGSFTGFIELSENVLSGDYYTVYHQGRSMSVAWVGSAERLVTDDEAFEQANDEVGIYEVKPAEIDTVEIPEPAEGATEQRSDADASTAVGDDIGPAEGSTSEPSSPEPTADTNEPETADAEDTDASETERNAGGPPGSKTAGGPPGSKAVGGPVDSKTARGKPDRSEREAGSDDAPAEPDHAADPDAGAKTESGTPTANGPTAEEQGRDADTSTSEPDSHSERTTEPADTTEERPARSETRTEQNDRRSRSEQAAVNRNVATGPDPNAAEQRSETDGDTRPGQQQSQRPEPEPEPVDPMGNGDAAADLETRSIPSLDPNRSASSRDRAVNATQPQPAPSPSRRNRSGSDQRRDRPARQQSPTGGSTPERTQDPKARPQSPDGAQSEPAGPADTDSTGQSDERDGRVEELEAELDERTSELSELEAELEEFRETNEDLREERDRLESELADARAEIERLEERLDAEQAESTPSGARLSGAEAIDGTNLFVRYHSKGEATLEQARDGDASREQVEQNLRLEHHTQFESADATVDGTPFGEFLDGSSQYRFVDWLVRDLLYEIRETGHASAMKDLYEALPEIDRAELNGSVSVTYTEDGQQTRSQERFDVVVRDRMGHPLVVANINDSRDPATDEQMTDLVRNAERVGNASDSLAAAFLVTSSFFEPGALETAREATSSGLFSRDKRKSFVNLSRKDGFHLCLLEARNQEFHLAVPEL